MKHFHLHLSKKLFFETLRSGEKYSSSSCTGVFYENKCSEKYSENSRIQRLWEDSFVEPEAEREATGFSEQFGFDKATAKRATFPLSCRRKTLKNFNLR